MNNHFYIRFPQCRQNQFPPFPPLPPPPPPSTTNISSSTSKAPPVFTAQQIATSTHEIVQPVCNSQVQAQDMVANASFYSYKHGRYNPKGYKVPAPQIKKNEDFGHGAFSAWDCGGGDNNEPVKDPQQSTADALVAAEAVIKRCPQEVQLVFNEGLRSGARPELVKSAAEKYLNLATERKD